MILWRACSQMMSLALQCEACTAAKVWSEVVDDLSTPTRVPSPFGSVPPLRLSLPLVQWSCFYFSTCGHSPCWGVLTVFVDLIFSVIKCPGTFPPSLHQVCPPAWSYTFSKLLILRGEAISNKSRHVGKLCPCEAGFNLNRFFSILKSSVTEWTR